MQSLSKTIGLTLLFCSLLLASAPARAQSPAPGITIDVPVKLKEAKVLFNMGRISLDGKDIIALVQMQRLVDHFKANATNGKIVAIFHRDMGVIGLTDEAYNREKKVTTGNPYKDQIKKLAEAGVDFEFCANSMAAHGWVNKDLLPQFKVTTGAMYRIIELAQNGYVVLAP
jgi:intracellular sulfur oxidation DsrE/DsrF family protein